MGQQEFAAERDWLAAYCEHFGSISLVGDADPQKCKHNVGLPEILSVLRNPTFVSSDRNYDGCIFTISGRNCDGEEILLSGCFNSGSYEVQINYVERK